MNKKFNFIKTSDKETKEALLNLGFQLVDETSGIATFINDNSTQAKKVFAEQSAELKKLTFSNMLAI